MRARDMSGEFRQGTVASYAAGFILCLILTLSAFWLTHQHLRSRHVTPSDGFMLAALGLLALVQLFVQLVFFLHLDKEAGHRWKLLVLLFSAGTVIIVVAGSIWIMSNLDNHHQAYGKTHDGHILQTPSQTNGYIIQDEGINP